MKSTLTILLFTVTLLVTANCGKKSGDTEIGENEFRGKGTVVSIDKVNGTATIEHDPIEGLMSAMTMTFPAADKKILQGIKQDDEVSFSLIREERTVLLVSMTKTGEKKRIDGAEIYKASCAKCHGDKGEGRKKGIPLIEGHALNHPEEDFLKQVKEGGEDMPSFSDKLSEEEIKAVVRYVRDEIQKGLRKENEGGHKH